MTELTNRQRISKAVLRSAIRKSFPWRRYPRSRIILRDATYLKYDFNELMECVKDSDVIKREYVPEFYDCNTGADALAADLRWKCIGSPFGTVTFSYVQDGQWLIHAMCVFYDAQHKCFRYVESKNGLVKTWKQSWKLAEMRF